LRPLARVPEAAIDAKGRIVRVRVRRERIEVGELYINRGRTLSLQLRGEEHADGGGQRRHRDPAQADHGFSSSDYSNTRLTVTLVRPELSLAGFQLASRF
jgi:hypothetical protein